MYKPKINKKLILQLSLDFIKIIKKTIKEELYGDKQTKDKKVAKSNRGNSSGTTDKIDS